MHIDYISGYQRIKAQSALTSIYEQFINTTSSYPLSNVVKQAATLRGGLPQSHLGHHSRQHRLFYYHRWIFDLYCRCGGGYGYWVRFRCRFWYWRKLDTFCFSLGGGGSKKKSAQSKYKIYYSTISIASSVEMGKLNKIHNM